MSYSWLSTSRTGRFLALLIAVSLPAPALAGTVAAGVGLGKLSRISTTVAAVSSEALRCSAPDRSAAIAGLAPIEVPEIARLMYADTGSVKVQVDLSSTGDVLHVGILRTSGNYALDRAAKQALEKSRYIAETHNCAGIGGSYSVEVNFES